MASLTPAALAGMTVREKRDLLKKLLREFPLTPGQRGMWFAHQLDPSDPAFNFPFAVRLRARVDVAAIESVLATLAERHAMLRARFRWPDSGPVQVIQEGAVPLQRGAGSVEEICRRPFDLEKEGAFRAHLIESGADDLTLALVWHHIAVDGWSLAIFLREFDALYRARVEGTEVRLPPAAPYADFVRWQRSFIASEAGRRAEQFWQTQLPHDLAPFVLPSTHARSATGTTRASNLQFGFGRELTAQLKNLADRTGTTLFTVLLACFQTLLYRYTGAPDVMVNTPLAGRDQSGFESTVGYFVNVVPMRVSFDREATFRSILERADTTVRGAIEHQNYPLAHDSRRNAFTDIGFVLQKGRPFESQDAAPVLIEDSTSRGLRWTLGGMPAESIYIELPTASTELDVQMIEHSEGLAGVARFQTDVFTPAAIERLMGHFGNIAAVVVKDVSQRIGGIEYLAGAERERILVEWNRTEVEWNRTERPYPEAGTLASAFELQAAETPAAVALLCGNARLSYKELDERANQVAHELIANGAAPGMLVGVLLPRSIEAVIAILGALKAGCAYVPLDPGFPAARIEYMLRDSGAPLVLTSSYTTKLPAGTGRAVLVDRISTALRARPRAADHPDGVAAIFYTSGSTGEPKGVRATHAGALNRCAWMREAYPFEPREVACLSTTMSFVDSVWALFGGLLSGTPVAIVPEEIVKDTDRFIEELNVKRVTRLVTVPSLLRRLLEDTCAPWKTLPCLKYWTSSGEPLPQDLAQRFVTNMPGRVLLNLYGCSEASADSCCWEVTRAGCAGGVKIGRPIANTRVYILDEYRKPLPAGIPGELYIGGRGVALGYLIRPELEAERFLPDPFGTRPDARMYRTGDFARYDEDGQIEYLGRADSQVKIRGHRVELAEIEAVLSRHPGVRQAAAELGKKGLAAYIIPAGNTNDAASLRAHAAAALPDFMVPSAFVIVDRFPLLPNGKLDRKALPAVEAANAERVFVECETVTERQVAATFASALKIDRVGALDGFLELGGDSLAATRAISRLRRELGRPVPLRLIFDYPSVRELAHAIDGGAINTDPRILPIRSDGAAPPLFWVHGELRFRELALLLGPDQPVIGLQIPESAEFKALKTVEQIAAFHVRTLGELYPRAPYRLAGFCVAGLIAYEMAQQLRRSGARVELLALADTKRPGPYSEPGGSPLQVPPRSAHAPRERRLATIAARTLWGVAFHFNWRVEAALRDRVRGDAPEGFLPLVYASLSYRPQPYEGRLTLFRAADFWVEGDMGWAALARGGFDLSEIPGSHDDLFNLPAAAKVAEVLQRALSAETVLAKSSEQQ